MKINKLVRDKIPDIIRKNGSNPILHIAEDAEYKLSLINKLHEEVDEFLENPSAEEAADILEVLQAIGDFEQINLESLEIVREKKYKERGGFKKKIILEGIE